MFLDQLDLTAPLGPTSPVRDDDVRNTKYALNRLGLYLPDPKLGMNEFTDNRLFDAIRKLQDAHGLIADGKVGLNSQTLQIINGLLAQAGDKGSYIWMTREDDKVRRTHAAKQGEVFAWKDEPRPGEEPGCQCWAVEVSDGNIHVPTVNKERDRIKAILENKLAKFDINENPKTSNATPLYADSNLARSIVRKYSSTIELYSKENGINPDLVKSVMWAENARGSYWGLGYVVDRMGYSSSIMPMNIKTTIWHNLVSKDEDALYDPEKNIQAATILLRRISDRIIDPTPEKIAAIWEFTGAEITNDYSAYVERIFHEKPWL